MAADDVVVAGISVPAANINAVINIQPPMIPLYRRVSPSTIYVYWNFRSSSTDKVTSTKQTIDNPPPPPVGWVVSQSIHQLLPKVWCPRMDLFDSNPTLALVGVSEDILPPNHCVCVTQYKYKSFYSLSDSNCGWCCCRR